MHNPMIIVSGMIAVLTGMLRQVMPAAVDAPDRDRGAVSIEQVLWYAAAAVSVAVVAAIIWSQIRDTASTPVQSPSAP